MSKLLAYMQRSHIAKVTALKEWAGAHGEMGVYQTEMNTAGYMARFLYIAVLLHSGIFWNLQYKDGQKRIALEEAQVIADFAGAEEVQQESE